MTGCTSTSDIPDGCQDVLKGSQDNDLGPAGCVGLCATVLGQSGPRVGVHLNLHKTGYSDEEGATNQRCVAAYLAAKGYTIDTSPASAGPFARDVRLNDVSLPALWNIVKDLDIINTVSVMCIDSPDCVDYCIAMEPTAPSCTNLCRPYLGWRVQDGRRTTQDAVPLLCSAFDSPMNSGEGVARNTTTGECIVINGGYARGALPGWVPDEACLPTN